MNNRGRIKKSTHLQPGDMFIYRYLWGWQLDQGMDIGEKRRPCVVVMRAEEPQGVLLGILPITSQPVRDFSQRMIVPYLEREGVGMDPNTPQSISKSEVNVEWAGKSSNLAAVERVWSFSPQFSKKLRTEFRENFEAGTSRVIMRRFIEPEYGLILPEDHLQTEPEYGLILPEDHLQTEPEF